MEDKLLTSKQACQRYSISKYTLYKWTSNKKIPYLKIGALVRFKREELEKWEKGNSFGAGDTELI